MYVRVNVENNFEYFKTQQQQKKHEYMKKPKEINFKKQKKQQPKF